MKIHSDKLTVQDILNATPKGCYLATFSHKDFGRTKVGYEGSRKRAHGYIVRLSGSNRSVMNGLPDKAATWEEWGNFIAALFAIDGKAIIGCYDSAEHFVKLTNGQFNPWPAAMVHYG